MIAIWERAMYVCYPTHWKLMFIGSTVEPRYKEVGYNKTLL